MVAPIAWESMQDAGLLRRCTVAVLWWLQKWLVHLLHLPTSGASHLSFPNRLEHVFVPSFPLCPGLALHRSLAGGWAGRLGGVTKRHVRGREETVCLQR